MERPWNGRARLIQDEVSAKLCEEKFTGKRVKRSMTKRTCTPLDTMEESYDHELLFARKSCRDIAAVWEVSSLARYNDPRAPVKHVA